MVTETFLGEALKFIVLECIKKGFTDPLLKNLLAPIANHIEHKFDARKADKELKEAFELIIKNSETSSDNDGTLALLKNWRSVL
jgi:hypothetical protein